MMLLSLPTLSAAGRSFVGYSLLSMQTMNVLTPLVWMLLLGLVFLFFIVFWFLTRPGQGEEEVETEQRSAEAVPAAEVAAAETVPVQPDDLKRIEGIGPKIAGILNENGITTFAQLADTDVSRLQQILEEAGLSRIAHPQTWPEQAQLAAAGDWEKLEHLQDSLKGGRRA